MNMVEWTTSSNSFTSQCLVKKLKIKPKMSRSGGQEYKYCKNTIDVLLCKIVYTHWRSTWNQYGLNHIPLIESTKHYYYDVPTNSTVHCITNMWPSNFIQTQSLHLHWHNSSFEICIWILSVLVDSNILLCRLLYGNRC